MPLIQTEPDGNVPLLLMTTPDGKVTAVISPMPGSCRLTVTLKPEKPSGAISNTTSLVVVPPIGVMIGYPLVICENGENVGNGVKVGNGEIVGIVIVGSGEYVGNGVRVRNGEMVGIVMVGGGEYVENDVTMDPAATIGTLLQRISSAQKIHIKYEDLI